MLASLREHYRKAYEATKRELADLIERQQRIEKRLLVVRESIQTLAALCESEGIVIEPSPEASYLLVKVTLADEIRIILRALNPLWLRPNEIKSRMARLGHDISKYKNPQATIHMVLKRMAESGEIEETVSQDRKTAYRMKGPTLAEQITQRRNRERAITSWDNLFRKVLAGRPEQPDMRPPHPKFPM